MVSKSNFFKKAFKLSKNAAFAAAQKVNKTARNFSITGESSLLAALSPLNDLAWDPSLVSKINNVIKNHGVSQDAVIKALPGDLEKFGSNAVEHFLNSGDKLGKHWSHIESQLNNPEIASSAQNAIWEDGSINIVRGSKDMTTIERINSSFDNHKDGLIATIQTEDFWRRSLGNAFEASVYAAAITAIDLLLKNRNEIINGSLIQKKRIINEILKKSGLIAAGAFPVSIFLGLVVMIIPGANLILMPLGIYGAAGLGLKLIDSAINNPSDQELKIIELLKSYLSKKQYLLKST